MTIEDPILIKGKEYKFDDLPPLAQKMITYMQTIDTQLEQMASQMELLQMSREGCYSRLISELEKEDGSQKEST